MEGYISERAVIVIRFGIVALGVFSYVVFSVMLVAGCATILSGALSALELTMRGMPGARPFILGLLHGVETILLGPLLPTAVTAVVQSLPPVRRAAGLEDVTGAEGRQSRQPDVREQRARVGAPQVRAAEGETASEEVQRGFGRIAPARLPWFMPLEHAERVFVSCLGAVLATDLTSRFLTPEGPRADVLVAEGVSLVTVSGLLWALSKSGR